jgi:hypothetical protein
LNKIIITNIFLLTKFHQKEKLEIKSLIKRFLRFLVARSDKIKIKITIFIYLILIV